MRPRDLNQLFRREVPIKLLPGRFTFLQFETWFDDVHEFVWPLPGVTGWGLSDHAILIAVDPARAESAKSCVRDRLQKLLIPEEAVVLKAMRAELTEQN